MIDRILVPLDGSRVAEEILPHLRLLLYRAPHFLQRLTYLA